MAFRKSTECKQGFPDRDLYIQALMQERKEQEESQ